MQPAVQDAALDVAAEGQQPRPSSLFAAVMIISVCGLVYELLAGTLASYLLGDSITQFSTVIGVYLFAMGVGSWASRFVEGQVAHRFVEVELAVGVVGGVLAPLLFLCFTWTDAFRVVLYGSVFVIGSLVGLEIPLLLRILKDVVRFKDLVGQVLAFDYLGALAASLLFPLFLVPRLGLVRTSLLFGLINVAVGAVDHLGARAAAAAGALAAAPGGGGDGGPGPGRGPRRTG